MGSSLSAPVSSIGRSTSLWGAQPGAGGRERREDQTLLRRQAPGAALVDSAALLALIGAYASVTRRVDRPAAVMMRPYGARVAFATLLNEEIVRRNG